MTRLTQAQIEAVLEHGVDIPGRRIFLHGDVEEDSIGLAIRGLYMLAEISKEPIELFITSYGGEVDEAFALHDVTRTIKVPVHTVALGKCMSAAPLLVACGHPGERYVSENTLFMLHDCSLDEIEGSPAYIEGQAKVARAQMKSLAQLIARYSKKPASHWAAMFAGKVDRFFDAEQAVTWGLVDNIWSEK